MTDIHQPTVQVIDVDPDLAKKWLESNTHNRTVRDKVIATYAKDMAAGRWRFTGDPIRFAADGTLLDGQHRLMAVIQSGSTARMPVWFGLDNGAQEATDIGARRSMSDILRLRGEKNTMALAALLRRITLWQQGHRKYMQSVAVTNAEMLATLAQQPQLRDLAAWATNSRQRYEGAPASVYGLTRWLFDSINSDDSAFFFGRLIDGQGLAKGDAIYELRRTLDDNRHHRARMVETVVTAVVIKAWNAYREGRRVGVLRYRPGGVNPETFPEPR